MSPSHPALVELATADWVRCERIVQRFEDDWRQGQRRPLDEYLPDGPERGAVLVELAHVELEYRLQAGETARAEDYLGRHPQLAEDRAAALELILAEHVLRRRAEPDLGADEYAERFPQYRTELAVLLRLAARAAPRARTAVSPGKDGSGRLGKYELLEAVGRGSFGVVYRARDTELGRVVALKLPRDGAPATPEEGDRFLREARSAARLHHPSIVAVYDAGCVGGAWFLSSEFVAGTTLADRLAQGPLDPKAAAQLLLRAAEALDHAHRHGVIHRDLKPSNILLDQAGEPHLADFGLAKSGRDEATLTQEGDLLGTPAYMSPELARGDARQVDGRSDVYSLGVVLYEMLTGERPFRGRGRMVLAQVLEEEPRPPRSLNEAVPRDLETVCLKAMAKEPGGRYPSAAALADDLRRFLEGRPVQARPVSAAVKAWRWCRRRPVPAALGAAPALAVTLGFAGVSWEWRQAAAERRQAETNLAEAERGRLQARHNFLRSHQAANLLIFFSQKEAVLGPELEPFRKQMQGEALRFHREFVRENEDDAALENERAMSYNFIAYLEGELGDEGQATAAAEKGLALWEELHRREPANGEFLAELAWSHRTLARRRKRAGLTSEAMLHYQQSRDLLERLVKENPTPTIRGQLAEAYFSLGEVQRQLGDSAAACRSAQQAVQLHEDPRAEDGDKQLPRGLAQSCYLLAATSDDLGRPAEALRWYGQARDHFRILAGACPRHLSYRRDLAAAWHNIGNLQGDAGHLEDAAAAYRQALAIRQRLAEEENKADFPSDLAGTCNNLAEALEKLGHRDEAAGFLRQAVAQQRRALEKAPHEERFRRYLDKHYRNLARVLTDLGKPAEAAEVLRAREQLAAAGKAGGG